MAAALALGAAVKLGAAAVLAVWALPMAAHAELFYLIVGGLGGETRYETRFTSYADSLATAARRTVTDESRVVLLKGEDATREALRAALDTLAERTDEADSLAVVLIGHGSFDGTLYKLNLPGPDIDGVELGTLLDAIPARAQLIVNATSASGAVLESWTADGRAVITATRSGAERNATRFAEHWADALSNGEADINKNDRITAQEAFDFASRKVADSFEEEGALATEHPQIAGDLAGRFDVARLTARATETPRLQALTGQLVGLEEQIAELRLRRESMPPDEYLASLQELLVQLALVQQQIDEAAAE
jgi:hypothetical protein